MLRRKLQRFMMSLLLLAALSNGFVTELADERDALIVIVRSHAGATTATATTPKEIWNPILVGFFICIAIAI